MADNKNDEKSFSAQSTEQVAASFKEAFPSKADEEHILPAADNVEELHHQIAELNKALQEAQEKVAGHWERLLRKEAEFQNLQRRAELDVENARKFAIERFANELLEVMDSLEQGLNYAQAGKVTVENLTEGMTLTHNVLSNALDKHGIKPVTAEVGAAFDPNYHQALSTQATQEMEPNRIMMVIQKGYLLNNRLLRPARVIVSKAIEG